MSRWFRHYAGMMRDEKLVRVAVRSKQPVERVVWVWGAILESASEINDGGRYDFDPSEAAYFLRCDETDLMGVVSTLTDLGHVADGVVAKWADRQFDSDKSRERQKRYRDRLAAQRDVTAPSPDADVTPQETETEADTSSLRSEVRAPAKPTPRQQLEAVLDAERAAGVIEHRQRLRKPLTERAAKLLADNLAKFPDPNVAADRMIEKGWLSIEPEWGSPPARGSPPAKSRGVGGVFSQLVGQMEDGQDNGNRSGEATGAPILSLPYRRQG